MFDNGRSGNNWEVSTKANSSAVKQPGTDTQLEIPMGEETKSIEGYGNGNYGGSVSTGIVFRAKDPSKPAGWRTALRVIRRDQTRTLESTSLCNEDPSAPKGSCGFPG